MKPQWEAPMRLFALILILPGLALATPPQIVSATDEVVGITDTHLYLLRSLQDNEGSHYVTTTDQLLVKKAIGTGEDERFWPLRRTTIEPDWDDPDERYVLRETPLATTHDLVEVLRQNAVQPMIEGLARDAGALNWSLADDMLTLTYPHDGTQIAVPTTDLAAGIMRNLSATRQAMPPTVLEGGFDALLDYPDYAIAATCQISRYHILWRGADRPDTMAVRIDCDDLDLGPPIALYVVVTAP